MGCVKVLFVGLCVFCAPPCIVIHMFESYLVIEEAMCDVTVVLRMVFFWLYFTLWYFVLWHQRVWYACQRWRNSFYVEGAGSVFLRNGGIQLS
jgi:hypothetical protein